ncbi:MAG TPA: transposase [Kiritimatiellia bacterium]|nr:transposase [Kiritimatiellia bacterium]
MAGGIYHVTSRGNERQVIFRDDRDRDRFLERLAKSAISHQVRVYLYCLMPNHIHLLVETPLGNLDRFMGSLLTGYTVYFNRRHHRVGHLMQGRYSAQLVEGNEYLLKLSRYIHLNPVQVEDMRLKPMAIRLASLRGYRWSSFWEYIGKIKPSGWLTTGPVLAMLEDVRGGSPCIYARYVESGLAQTDDEFVHLMKERGIAVGSARFIESIKSQHERQATASLKREDVSFRQLRTPKDVKEVETAVREIVGESWALIKVRKTGGTVRGFMAWALQKYAGLTQREIAPRVRVSTGAGVSLMIRGALEKPEAARWRKALDLRFKG